ncbi:MAG: LemA family protein [Chitinophagales bacterium]|nr:LemA family protein [Chitinophagales bacterium]MDW8273166.1 LemA family protein [Chitinophagales bacterium]
MKKILQTLTIIILSLSLSSCGYNTLVKEREAVTAQWANVETAYQRRADLIPNLVNTVKGYANFEQQTLTAVVEARAKATSIQVNANDLKEEDIARFQEAQNELKGALSRLLATVENYPDLKANKNFLELQAQLEGTENRISVERNKYNQLAQQYNANLQTFPTLITAKIFGFQPKPYFKADAGAEKAPTVTF